MRHLSGSRKIYAFGSLILGVLLLLWPVSALRMVAYAAGIIVMAGGVASILAHFRRRPRTSIASLNLVIGVLVTLVGGWIFMNPDNFASILPTAIGYLIVLSGIVNLLEAFSLSRARYRKWWSTLFAGVVSIFMGLLLVNHAFGIAATMVRLGGLFLLYNGVSVLWISRRVDQYMNYTTRRRNMGGKARNAGGGSVRFDTSDPDIIDANDYREM